MERKRTGRIVILAGILLIVIGGVTGFIGYLYNKSIEADIEVTEGDIANAVNISNQQAGQVSSGSSIEPDIQPVSQPAIIQGETGETGETGEPVREKTETEEIIMMEVEESSKEAKGLSSQHIDKSQSDTIYLSISRLDIYSKVFTGVTSENLRNGVGRFEGSAEIGEEGNVCIAGHSSIKYDCILNGIDKIRLGDKVSFLKSGEEYVYKVDSIEVIEPTDIQVLRQVDGLKELTIITCAEQGKKRLCIQATLIE